MPAHVRLPPTIVCELRAAHGEPIAVESLGGMGRGRVFRAHWPDRTLVVKRATRVEAHVYRAVLPAWSEHRHHAPALALAVEDGGRWWLGLEDVPAPLPPPRRLADPEILATLRHLHESGLPAVPAALGPYRPSWSPSLTARALAALPAPEAANLAPLLETVRRAAQPLFAPRCPLSGDPNPANWGLRDDGSLVLFDFERFCRGTPALDLAISIPGLGDFAAARLVAARYIGATSRAPGSEPEDLARAIVAAKVWSVVEFLARNAGRRRAGTILAWVSAHFPGWALSLAPELTRGCPAPPG